MAVEQVGVADGKERAKKFKKMSKLSAIPADTGVGAGRNGRGSLARGGRGAARGPG